MNILKVLKYAKYFCCLLERGDLHPVDLMWILISLSVNAGGDVWLGLFWQQLISKTRKKLLRL